MQSRSRTQVNSQLNLGQRNVYLGGRNYRPSYQSYPWYNGYWGGWGRGPGGYGLGLNAGYGGYGRGFGLGSSYGLGYPLGWGLGGWGLGSPYYTSGYMSYYNPYYVGGSGGVYNYSQPVPVAVDGTNSAANEVRRSVDAAREQFINGYYDEALAIVDRGIAAHPSDAVLHEFRALILFALKDYPSAAATVHSVLAVGPGWDWPTLRSFYPEAATYSSQLRALEAHVKANPDQSDSRFLLAYHSMSLGQPDTAIRQLRHVVRLTPDDHVAADLLRMLAPPTVAAADSAEPAPGEPAAGDAVRPISIRDLEGAWNASRDDGSTFKLDLQPDKTFMWDFLQGERNEKFSGTYETEGSLLILQRKEGGALVGQTAFDGSDRFAFRLVGAPPEDKGLTFTR